MTEPEELLFSPHEYRYPANATITRPVRLMSGALIRVSNGVTLRLAGGLDAPVAPVFAVEGTGRVLIDEASDGAVLPEWWGAQVGGSADPTARAIANVQAIRAARDSIIERGTVQFQAGVYLVNDWVGINRPYICYRGAGRHNTILQAIDPSKDVTGIDGTLQAGFTAASAYIDRCEHTGIGTYRETPGADQAILANGAKGFRLRWAANARVEGVFTNDAIGYYETQTSGCQIDIDCVRGHHAADTATTRYVGHYSDCTLAGKENTSSNGSSRKRAIINCQNFTGVSWGGLAYGYDLRDQFYNDFETAFTSHGLQIEASSPGSAYDIKLNHVTLDSWSKSGLSLINLGEYGRVSVDSGYSAPGVAGANVGPSVLIQSSSRVDISDQFDALGGANYALHTGVKLTGSTSKCRIAAQISGCRHGVVVDGANHVHLSPMIVPLSGPPPQRMERGIALVNGATRCLVEGAIIDGAGGGDKGVVIDASSTYNTVGPCIINPGAIDDPVFIDGVERTAPGTYGTHNVLLAGTVD